MKEIHSCIAEENSRAERREKTESPINGLMTELSFVLKRATILTFLASSAVCGLVGYLQGANSICELLGAGLVPAVLSLVFVAFASIGRFRTIATRYRILLYTSLFVLIGESLMVIEIAMSKA